MRHRIFSTSDTQIQRTTIAAVSCDLDVRQVAVEALAYGWREDPETLPWLKARARSDKHPTLLRSRSGTPSEYDELFTLICYSA